MKSSFEIGSIVKVKEIKITNNVGGTKIIKASDLDKPFIEVKVENRHYDYETGEWARGSLVNPYVQKVVYKMGISEYSPEDYKKYGDDLYQRALKAFDNYNPKIVRVSEFDIVEGVA